MNICIGGDLDGQVIEKEGMSLKANSINSDFKSEYFKQLFIQGDNKYRCWIDTTMPFGEATNQVFELIRRKNGYNS